MVRITIKDAREIISFLSAEDTMLRLVAACSINPSSLGELLMAANTYQRRIASTVMASLMEFDKALQRQGPGYIQAAISTARTQERPLEGAFQVIDEMTEDEALKPRECGLVVIDLTEQLIRASEGVDVPASGEVYFHDGREITDRRVTYFLPQQWSVQALTDSGRQGASSAT